MLGEIKKPPKPCERVCWRGCWAPSRSR
uniref:Uncharacterized protein n=1 Tax=Anopheles albimanus TaxID=7167 RepID=A0A182FXI2_ANOAL